MAMAGPNASTAGLHACVQMFRMGASGVPQAIEPSAIDTLVSNRALCVVRHNVAAWWLRPRLDWEVTVTIDERRRLVYRAREAVLCSSELPPSIDGIQPRIIESWRRSLMYGLDPDRCTPSPSPSTELSNQLRTVSAPIIDQRRAALSQTSCSLAITDVAGRILNRWVEDGHFASVLDAQSVMPEYSVAEADTGTTSGGIVLETGHAVTVAGPEHFNGTWLEFTCAGAPIRHPITRRLIGSLNLTVRYCDTTPILQAWVTDIATDIERALLDNASHRERLLMAAYLAENRDTRHPVLCLDDQTVISNAPAARRLSSVDQALLWEHASTYLQGSMSSGEAVALSDGSFAHVEITGIRDGAKAIGAVVRLKSDNTDKTSHTIGTPSAPASIAGLAGRSPAWRRLSQRVRQIGSGSLLAIGEPGVGKFAVASALADNRTSVVDALSSTGDGEDWLRAVRQACESGAPEVLLRRIGNIGDHEASAAVEVLDHARSRGIRISATISTGSALVDRTPLFDWFDHVVTVPALSDRIEDLPVLLDALTSRHISGVRTVRWLPDAVQTLSRVHFPRNVASLNAVVREVLTNNRRPTIGAVDLPPDLRARASRRALVGLEGIEAKAIMEAMHQARGNKRLAADSLGIARSTLYRKVRALGIDLSSSNF